MITLIKAVLSVMPLHYMQAFKVIVGIIRHIDKMRRNFMWKGNDICKGINCLVNWERVCSMKINGGLGIIDLQCQNDALLTKWFWNIEKCPESLWANTVKSLHGLDSAAQIQLIRQDISFFFFKGFGKTPTVL